MADNSPAPEGAPQPPSSPTAPPLKKSLAGKVVVLLSSVAKAPPVKSQALPHPPTLLPPVSPVKETPERPSLKVVAPPPLAPKPTVIEGKLARPGGNAEVKLPPQVSAPRWPTFSGSPVGTPPEAKEKAPSEVPAAAEPPKPADIVTPPPPAVPIKAPSTGESKKTTARLFIPPIKLNQPAPEPLAEDMMPGESIFLAPGETEEKVLPPKIEAKPPVVTPPPLEPSPSEEVKEAKSLPTVLAPPPSMIVLPPIESPVPVPTTLRAPEILSGTNVEPPTKASRLPPPLPLSKPAELPAAAPIQAVPKLISHEPTAHPEKLRPPQLPTSDKSEEVPEEPAEDSAESTGIHRAPAMIPTHATAKATPPPLPLPREVSSTPADSTVSEPVDLKENAEPHESSPKVLPPPIQGGLTSISVARPAGKPDEAKPALRPAVLPNKSLVNLKPDAPVARLEVPPVAKHPDDEKLHAPVDLQAKSPLPPKEKAPLPMTRVERSKKRRVWEMAIFYVFMLIVGVVLYFGTLRFCRETRVEGQVIPPAGMSIADEVWIVNNDGNQLNNEVAGISEDLAAERTPLLQEMHEREDHVQRVQADLAMREERIHLLQAQIQSAKDEQTLIVKQARDAAQQLWDGPGAELDADYDARQTDLENLISSRAKSLNLNYAPDPTYRSPEVWANAYRLGLYDAPKGVDEVKEYGWLNDQMKQWRDFVKSQDDKREQLREQAAQLKLAPATKLADLNAKIDELQHRIDATQAEEDPLKPELQQAQGDLAESQTSATGLDEKYYKQLSALPSQVIAKRLLVDSNGRFTWADLQNDRPYAEGELEHHFWIFARATRADGREYWALGRFTIAKDHTVGLLIEPDSFVSTKAMLRPDLSPDEQAQ